jgi:hypothetical protein
MKPAYRPTCDRQPRARRFKRAPNTRQPLARVSPHLLDVGHQPEVQNEVPDVWKYLGERDVCTHGHARNARMRRRAPRHCIATTYCHK